MKHLKDFIYNIQEGLKLGSSKINKDITYTEKPSTSDELFYIIKDRLKKDINADLNDIDVSEITNMQELFQGLDPHNIKIDKWDVSNVWNMKSMFDGCYNFNADISDWDVKNVETANYMFANCMKFNSDISWWKLDSLKYADNMFINCKSFNQDLSLWDWSHVVAENAFIGCNKLDDAYFPNNYVDENLNIQEGLKLGSSKINQFTEHPKTKEELRKIIENRLEKDKNANLNDIDTSKIEDMSYLFENLDPHNIKLNLWDVSHVTNMTELFFQCRNLVCDISDWDVSEVDDMSYMFCDCQLFNSDLSKWKVSKVADMTALFYNCKNFNSDISGWDVSHVKGMTRILSKCDKFNHDLSKWDTKSLINAKNSFKDSPLNPKYYPDRIIPV